MQLKLKFFMILALLLTTMTAGAQMPLQLTLYPNYEGATEVVNIPVDYDYESGKYHYSLTNFNPANYPQYIRDGHSIVGWSETSTGPIIYEPNATVTLTDNLTLYAIWEDTPLYSLKYTITSESQRMAQLTGYLGNKPTGALVIPASVTIGGNSYAVTSIGVDAFNSCPGLTSVTFAAGSQLASIGNRAFGYCGGLTSVTIPDGVTSIGVDAFISCPGLTSVTFAAGSQLASIGNRAFGYCGSLTSVTIPDGVTSIGDDAFNNCPNLISVTLNSNPAIGVEAFPAGATVTMNLTGNEGKTDEYWMTFFNENYSFQVPDETKIFKAALDESKLTLTELTTDKIVKANNPVILKSTSGPISLTLVSSGGSNNFDGNNLSGMSSSAGETASDPSIMFVLNKGANGVGFYRLAPGKRLGHGKAFLWYNGALSNFFGMEEETTGLKSIDNGQWIMDNYYDLSGRKVTNPKKGIFIHNGRKEVVK